MNRVLDEVKYFLDRPEAFIFGTSLAVAAVVMGGGVIIETLADDPGRGTVIKECPNNYEGWVQVLDPGVLKQLGEIASDLGIDDPEASDKDAANRAGELACSKIMGPNSITMLLPAGLDALQRSTRIGTLPNGLVWASTPPSR